MPTADLGSVAGGATTGAGFGPWGAAVGGFLGLVGGFLGNHAAKKAAKAQREAEERKLQFQRQQYERQQRQLQPYLDAGKSGLAQLNNLGTEQGKTGFLNDFYRSPEYGALSSAARNQQLASAEATGQLGSAFTGNNISAIAPNLGLGALNQQRQYAGNLVGLGSQALGLGNQNSQNFSNQYGQGLQNLGAIQAGGYSGQGQAWNDALTGIGGIASNYYNQQNNQQFLKQLYQNNQ